MLVMSPLWTELESLFKKPVDLINLREVSTVFQKEIIGVDRRIYTGDAYAADEFEMLVLSFYQKLARSERRSWRKGCTAAGFITYESGCLDKKISIERCIAQTRKYYAMRANCPSRKMISGRHRLERATRLIDIANHLIKTKKLGLPQDSKDSFSLLQRAGLIDEAMRVTLQAMVPQHPGAPVPKARSGHHGRNH